MAEADTDGDGLISPEEFHDVMVDILKRQVIMGETETPRDTPGET